MMPLTTRYQIIAAECCFDLARQFVGLSVLNMVFFEAAEGLYNLFTLCFIEQAPAIFLSPVVGFAMVRAGEKNVLTATGVLMAVLSLALVFIEARWMTLATYVAVTVGALFFLIGRQSIIPKIIPKNGLIAFNALNERVALFGQVLGPFFIGSLIAFYGNGIALFLSGLLFFLSAAAFTLLPSTETSGGVPETGAGRRKDGVSWTSTGLSGDRKSLMVLCFAILGVVLFAGGMQCLGLPALFKASFEKGIADWGVVMSCFQAGACLATFLLSRVFSLVGYRTMLIGMVLGIGAALFALGFARTATETAAIMFVSGCCSTFIHILLESLIQQASPAARVTGVMALLNAYKGAVYLGAMMLTALCIAWRGPATLFIGGAVVFLAVALPLLAFRGKRLGHILSCG